MTPISAAAASAEASNERGGGAASKHESSVVLLDESSPGFTMNKSGFFGRSKELDELRRVQHQVVIENDDTSSALLLPAVLLWGLSGTGKSHLIQQFLSETQKQSPCYILQGKYDEYTGSSDPFSAIVQALNDFSSQLKNGPVEELERIRKCVKVAFQDDSDGDDHVHGQSSVLSALINVVPSLSILLEHLPVGSGSGGSLLAATADQSSIRESPSISSSSSSQFSLLGPQTSTKLGVTENVWNRLQYIFLQFVNAISTKEYPVYLFLDDLQWSSPVALELMANLVSHPELKHFLFLGSIRQEINPHNDEVMETPTDSPLGSAFLSRLQSQDKELTQITIQNLSLDDTVRFLSKMLNNHPINDDLKALAKKIQGKTQGNIFFTVQALEELQRNHILMYNGASFQWEWKFDTANGDDIPISNNVVAAIESKLKRLSQDLQDVLSIVAYVGATFDVVTLLHIIENEQQYGASSLFTTRTEAINEEYLCTLLEKAVLEQLLSNPIGGIKYRFTHDRIQQAAHGMIPYGEVRNMLRLRIGHCLLGLYRDHHQNAAANIQAELNFGGSKPKTSQTISSVKEDHGLLFVAADHLNSVPTKDHMFSVMLNLEVGERAIQMAALASASAYLQRAVNELKRVRDPWEEHYDISLRLHRARSDVELSLGHFQLGYSLGDEVLAKARSLDEKLPTYFSMAQGLGRQDQHLKSFKICMSATTQIGSFPKRWYLGHVVRDMMRIKRFLKNNTDNEILRLPLMTDERKLMAMKLMPELAVRAHMTKQMVVWLVAICKNVRNTIEFGLCQNSSMAFVFYGVLLASSGDQAMAIRCSDIARRIVSKTNAKSMAGWVCLITASFIVPFRLSPADVIQKHRMGYTSSMEAGEFEVGFINWQMSITTAYLAGHELQLLVQASETTLQQYKMYRVESLYDMTVEYLLTMQMLTGEKPINWDEVEISANRDIKREKLDPSQSVVLATHFYKNMVVATYFRKYDLGKKLAALYRFMTAEEKSLLALVARGVLPGINAAELYRETGKRRHLRMLNKTLNELKDIVRTRGSKFIHHVLMLKAELASIQKHSKNSRSVKDAYDLAIMVASNGSFFQDVALTCELAGEHCIRESFPNEETSAYFIKAVGFYEDWGCVVKVNDLKQRRSQYLTGLNENRRIKNTSAHDDGIVSSMMGDTASSRRAQLDMLATYTPSASAMGSSIADAETKRTFGLRESIAEEEKDDCDMSVLTDGS